MLGLGLNLGLFGHGLADRSLGLAMPGLALVPCRLINVIDVSHSGKIT